MTLLTAIQDACGELGLVSPTTVIGNADTTVTQMLALANREGRDISIMEGPWGGFPQLRKEYTFPLVPVGPYTGNTTSGSTTVSGLSSVSGLVAGYGIAGSGIPQSATIVSVGASSIVTSIPATVTATAASLQFGKIAYDLPSDINFPLTATFWNRNYRWQMWGPTSPQEWQTLISGLSASGPRIRFRIMGGKFYINPVPGAGQTDQIAYEYISTNWCTSASGTGQTRWAADTDLYVLDEDALVLGLIWRYRRAKGLDYNEERTNYDQTVDALLARSGSSRSLPLNASANELVLVSSANIPDGNWPSTA
jgi:hypothetical protein